MEAPPKSQQSNAEHILSEQDKSDVIMYVNTLIDKGYLDPARYQEAYIKLIEKKARELEDSDE